MTTGPMARAMRALRATALRHDGGGWTDGQLLDCFLAQRDEAAFEALVRRHGSMVLGTCHRVLGNFADAEDAFQAVFFVLARKAATVRPREQVGNWLYGVACRTALKARVAAARRRKHERQVIAMPQPEAAAEEQWQELQPILDQELERLPDKYRLPLVLCDLEGRTRRDVARQLGVPDGTLSNRITTARRVLAQRLTKRGITLSGGALAAVLAQNAASAGVPPALVVSTVKAATGGAAASAVSAGAAALTEGVLKAMLWNKLKPVAGLVMLAALAVGVGQTLLRAGVDVPPTPVPPPVLLAAEPQAKPEPPAAKGRLFYHLGWELVSTQPDGRQKQEHGRIFESKIQGYQVDSARLSPDGKVLAFGNAVFKELGDKPGVHPPDNIYLRDLTKDAKPELLVHIDGLEFSNWVWSPDGAKLAITTWDAQAITRNWIVDVTTKKVEEVTLPRYKFKDAGEIQMSIQAWSPDGTRFLANGDGLHLVKTDGTDVKRLTALPASLFGGRARFSPDGTKVLYVVASKEKGHNLYVADVKDGTAKALVEATNFHDLRACWSPDGKQIAYAVTPKDANGERGEETTLFVVNADGSNTRTVVTEKHAKNGIGLVLTDWR